MNNLNQTSGDDLGLDIDSDPGLGVLCGYPGLGGGCDDLEIGVGGGCGYLGFGVGSGDLRLGVGIGHL